MTARRLIIALLGAVVVATAPSPALAQDLSVPLEPTAPLTPTPQGAEPEPEPQAPEPAPAPEQQVTDTPAETSEEALAETGIDARLVLGIGLSLLLVGAGLRLRSLPERF